MSVISRLASSLNRRDEVPNQELAADIVARNDAGAVQELVNNTAHRSKDIQSDCIKTLYEIGALKPSLIAGYLTEFVRLLNDKNNRLQWGTMKALYTITDEKPDGIYAALPQLARAVDKGSVITRDHYAGILTKLLGKKKFADDAFHLLNEQLLSCPTNQLPMYAENAASAIPELHKTTFITTLQSRLEDFNQESKRKRVEKVLKKLIQKN